MQVSPLVKISHLHHLDPETRLCLYPNESSYLDSIPMFSLVDRAGSHKDWKKEVHAMQRYSQRNCLYECMTQAGFLGLGRGTSCNLIWDHPVQKEVEQS